MKKLVILGAGSGGAMMANKMRKDLDDDWSITLIDKDKVHHYQPGLLFVPFDINKPKAIRRSRRECIMPGIAFVISELVNVDWRKQEVITSTGEIFRYDVLFTATGCDIRAEKIEGQQEGWGNDISGYYRFNDCQEAGKVLKQFVGGKLAVNIAEVPIKCPVAPLEFPFLADWYIHKRGMRDKMDIECDTPPSGSFYLAGRNQGVDRSAGR